MKIRVSASYLFSFYVCIQQASLCGCQTHGSSPNTRPLLSKGINSAVWIKNITEASVSDIKQLG